VKKKRREREKKKSFPEKKWAYDGFSNPDSRTYAGSE
jgi:hypothetical protein